MTKTRVVSIITTIFAISTINTALAADCTISIGSLGPLSGGAASWGLAGDAGVRLAVEEVNRAGGLKMDDKQCTVKVVSYDSKYTAEGAAAGSNYLKSKGVSLIVGPTGSPEATGIKPVAARNKQLSIDASYALDAISPKYPLHFHQGGTPSFYAAPIVRAAKDRWSIKKVVIFAPNDQGGTDIAKIDAEAYRSQGIEVEEEYYKRGTTNFAPAVTRILRSNPDSVDTASTPPGDAGLLVRQLIDHGYTGLIGRLGGPGTKEIIEGAGGVDKLSGFYWFEGVDFDDPKIKEQRAKYKELLGKEAPDNTQFDIYASTTRLLLKSIETAGTTEAEKVAEIFANETPIDPYQGEGIWAGQELFGINHALMFPYGMGIVDDGVMEGIQILPLATD